jgi:hypothetical protein
MAPEQFTGQPADACSDIYSLGATYYTLLTGKPPFEAATAADAMAAHRNAPVPTLPGPAGRVIARALAKAPADRYPDAAALLADLEAILAPQPRRWLGFAALLLTAAVMAMMVWLVASPAGDEPETGWVSLFNGRDLSGWEVFVENGQLGHDPDSVFSVIEIDGGPAIRATGQKNGTLTSVAEHENFHLRLEYRWKGLEGKHNSGVMYHANGEHGSGFSGALPSHEYEIVPRNVGGYFRSGDHRLVDLAEVHRGRFVPIEPVLQRARARQDRELKTGRWNQIEIVCWRDSAVHVLNDFVTLVLARSRTPDGQPLTKGRLQLQSYQGEVYFRNIGIRPITAIPARFR